MNKVSGISSATCLEAVREARCEYIVEEGGSSAVSFRVTAISTSSTSSYTTKDAVSVVANPRKKLPQFSPDSLRYEQGKVGAVQDGRVSESLVGAMEYLTSILTSKVYDVAVESPLQHASKLSKRLGVNIWLKREDLQPVSSCYNLE
ncbi:threonine dehydratase biosynthetic protein [Artemisia annua]|uniref:Threonine dehydratase biosynthetic protein n=1 Tax=Artemisia annua TaxID=35608 RepID=A0A2U1NMP4_ARTAN|nr:threonine dehydratase biosynthetic protein [Artemisia annua]